MITVELTEDEQDELGNCADCCMEDWLSLRDKEEKDTAQWRIWDAQYRFWLTLARKLGCVYEDEDD